MLSNRSEPKQEEPTVYPTAVDKSATLRQPPRTEPKTPTAVVGAKIRFKGELIGEEDLLIQGKIEGTVDLKGHSLTVGDKGEVKANVSARTVNIEGRVDGDLYGEECIAIRSSSRVQGNIKAERVVLEDGAKFRGSIDMDMDEPSDVKGFANQMKENDAQKDKTKNNNDNAE